MNRRPPSWRLLGASGVVLMASLSFSQENAPEPEPAKTSGERCVAHVAALTAKDMEGRATGTKGAAKARRYVEEVLRAAGVKPAGTDGFARPFKFKRMTVARQVMSARSDEFDVDLEADVEFFARPGSSVGVAKAEGSVTFVGFGDDASFEGVNPSGVFMMLPAERPAAAGEPLVFDREAFLARLDKLQSRKPVAVIVVWSPERDGGPLSAFRAFLRTSRGEVPVCALDWDIGRVFVSYSPGGNLALMAQDAEKPAFRAFDIGVSAALEVETVEEEVNGVDLVGVLDVAVPGGDDYPVHLVAAFDAYGWPYPDDPDYKDPGAYRVATGVSLALETAGELARRTAGQPSRSVYVHVLDGTSAGRPLQGGVPALAGMDESALVVRIGPGNALGVADPTAPRQVSGDGVAVARARRILGTERIVVVDPPPTNASGAVQVHDVPVLDCPLPPLPTEPRATPESLRRLHARAHGLAPDDLNTPWSAEALTVDVALLVDLVLGIAAPAGGR